MPKLSVRSVLVIILVTGSLILAIADHNFRPTFGDLAKVGVGGYLGQMLPEASKRSGDSWQYLTRSPFLIAIIGSRWLYLELLSSFRLLIWMQVEACRNRFLQVPCDPLLPAFTFGIPPNKGICQKRPIFFAP